MEQGMEERFEDPTHPMLKQPLQPIEAYQNRRESQNLEELAQIENNRRTIDDDIKLLSISMFKKKMQVQYLERY